MGAAHWESTVAHEINSKLIRDNVHSDNDSNDGGRTTAARQQRQDDSGRTTAARRQRQDDSGKTATAMKKKEASS